MIDKLKKIASDIKKNLKKYFKDILFFIVLVCLTMIFSNPLAQFINKFIAEIDLGAWSVYIPTAVLALCIIAYTVYLWKYNFVPSKNLLFATFCLAIILYRTKLNDGNWITYVGIIVVLYICQAALLIKHVYGKLKQKETNRWANSLHQGFHSDEPIPVKENKDKPDNKGYAQYAENIAKKIKESHFQKSFAIGINGQWGSGKTSMSNLIRRHTQDEADVISIDFKPWSSSTPDTIIKDFFETLQDELSPYHAALSRLLIRYSRKLTTIDSNVITQTIEYAANYILDLDATNKVYDKINAALKDIAKKLLFT